MDAESLRQRREDLALEEKGFAKDVIYVDADATVLQSKITNQDNEKDKDKDKDKGKEKEKEKEKVRAKEKGGAELSSVSRHAVVTEDANGVITVSFGANRAVPWTLGLPPHVPVPQWVVQGS